MAVVASSQDTYWEEDDVFEKCVFASVFEDGVVRLGEAVEDAKGRYLAFYGPGSKTVQYFEQYNLFGDPSLGLVVLDPTSKDDGFNVQMSITRGTNGALVLQWTGGTTATQYLERSDSVGPSAQWVSVFTNSPPTALTNHFELAMTNAPGRAFYRIRVIR